MTSGWRFEQVLGKHRQYVLGEAGGNAAHAFYRMVQNVIPARSILAVDANPKALLMWKALGCATCLESEFEYLSDMLILPVDEHLRRRKGLTSALSQGDTAIVHSKRKARQQLARAPSVRLPRLLACELIAKPEYGAGSKGHWVSSDDMVVLERIDFDEEYDVDINTWVGMYCPRITWNLVNGNDTFVTLLGELDPRYKAVVDAAYEVVQTLGISGIIDVQLMRKGKDFYFLEAALRVSGSSWLNLHAFNNTVLGTRGKPFASINCSTKAGLVF
jgi:hypothetical protein